MGGLKKPTALRIMQGNVGRKKINAAEPKPEVEIPVPFGVLSAEAAIAWNKLAPMLFRLGVLTEADSMALTLICQTWGDYAYLRELEEKERTAYKQTPTLFGDEKDENAPTSRLRSQINAAAQLLDKLLTRFGLTPTSRANVVADLKKDEEGFAKFAKID